MFDAVCSLIKKLRSKSRPWYRTTWNVGNDAVQTSQYYSYDNATEPSNAGVGSSINEYSKTTKGVEDKRIVKKPVDVVNEIIVEKPIIMLNDIKGQIKVIEKRMKVFDEQGITNTSDEKMAIGFLKARQRYEKTKDLFKWQVTTSDKITALCGTYKLRTTGLNSYSRTMPMEAVTELENFMKAYKKVRTDVPPEMKLIIDEGGKETRKDPILLASSPFGRWWYILGAWDKEVLYIDDLVYNGK